MKTKMKSLVVGTLLLSSLAHAQSGAQGGGSFTEAQMKDFMGELSRYFSDPQSNALFPEVGAWEKANGAKFSDLIQSIEPKVVNHKVYGPFKEERDCVSFVNGGSRYFECDRSRMPESRLENQPLLYTILLHEAFVHAGIEKPTSETVPSKYPVSSRIGNTQNLSLVTYQKWVPKAVQARAVPAEVDDPLYRAWVPFKYTDTLFKPWPYTKADVAEMEKEAKQKVMARVKAEKARREAKWNEYRVKAGFAENDLRISIKLDTKDWSNDEKLYDKCEETEKGILCKPLVEGAFIYQSMTPAMIVSEEKVGVKKHTSVDKMCALCEQTAEEIRSRSDVIHADYEGVMQGGALFSISRPKMCMIWTKVFKRR